MLNTYGIGSADEVEMESFDMAAVARVNSDLSNICGCDYESVPVEEIAETLELNGFISYGIYGLEAKKNKGSITADVAGDLVLNLSWRRVSGRYTISAAIEKN